MFGIFSLYFLSIEAAKIHYENVIEGWQANDGDIKLELGDILNSYYVDLSTKFPVWRPNSCDAILVTPCNHLYNYGRL